MNVKISKLSLANKDDFYHVNSIKHDMGWCNCVAWWSEDFKNFSKKSAEENKEHREYLFSQGQFDGYILYKDDEPVGWSQVGKRDRLPNLKKVYAFEPDSRIWAITCFALIPKVRGQNFSSKFLNLILDDLINLDVEVLQAYPCRGAEDAWTGPESIYLRSGFRIVRDHDSMPIYQKELIIGS